MKKIKAINTVKIKFKIPTSFHNIFFLILSLWLCKCEKTYSLYDVNIINNEKICVHMYLEDNYSRRFLQSLKESPHIAEMPNCHYLLIVALDSNYRTVNNVAGVRLENKVYITAKYNLFKYEKIKSTQIENILENPTIRDFEQYTSNKNAYLTKGRSLATNENAERNFDSAGQKKLYTTTTNRIKNILPLIGGGAENAESVYMTNNLLLSSLEQSKADAENQLAKTLGQTIINSAILDILNYYDEKEKKECIQLYNTNNAPAIVQKCHSHWKEHEKQIKEKQQRQLEENKQQEFNNIQIRKQLLRDNQQEDIMETDLIEKLVKTKTLEQQQKNKNNKLYVK